MANEIANIISNLPTTLETGLDEDTLAVAGGAVRGNKRISIKGRVFRKIVGGKEQSVNTDNHMNIIFVKMAHEPSRTFYGSAYREGSKVSPSCWSSDSKVPSSEVENPPAPNCADCPNSVKGSGQGGMGTACKLSWRTAVVLANDPEGDVYQLVLPATSAFGQESNHRWPFRPYVQMLANNNVSAGMVVTKMQFDIDAPVPRLLFSPAEAVPERFRDAVRRQGKTPAAENAVKLTVYKTDNGEDEEESAPTPVRRETAKAAASAPVADATEVIKKWTKKG